MKNDSMYSPSHIWHKDPVMDNLSGKSDVKLASGSHLPTEIWKDPNQKMANSPTVLSRNNSTEVQPSNQDKINRIEATLKKIAELLHSF